MKRLAYVALAAFTLSAAGCKKRAGQVCKCASDCQDGLVCAYGTELLENGECAPGSGVGECVPDEDTASGTGSGVDIIMFDDMPSKRDIGVGTDTGEDTGTETGESGTETGMETGEETGETGMETGEETGETGMETGEETGETGMETGTESSTT